MIALCAVYCDSLQLCRLALTLGEFVSLKTRHSVFLEFGSLLENPQTHHSHLVIYSLVHSLFAHRIQQTPETPEYMRYTSIYFVRLTVTTDSKTQVCGIPQACWHFSLIVIKASCIVSFLLVTVGTRSSTPVSSSFSDHLNSNFQGVPIIYFGCYWFYSLFYSPFGRQWSESTLCDPRGRRLWAIAD